MSRQARLQPSERDFLRLVASAAFTNPFTDERAEIDRRIAGASLPLSADERVRLLTPRLAQELARLGETGRANVSSHTGEDREIVETVIVFHVYHTLLDELDHLIQRQLEAGDHPVTVPFARRALTELRGFGFTHDESLRHFAMLYQLRRAYYFIGNSLSGDSPCMKDLRRRLWQNVVTHDIRLYARHLMDRMEDFSTLLLGETGTGKGTAALAIGRSGPIPFDDKHGRFVESFTRAFVAINLSRCPESLIESELFGHRKGAFTGAIESHEGVFARCSPHGAIFLDEIGEVSAQVQIKLLEVLQDRVFSPVGSQDRRRFRGRVVAATNRALVELRTKGAFRDDFYYRLCSDMIHVPPLRQRIEEDPAELPKLLDHVIGRMIGDESPVLVELVLEVIEKDLPKHYPWPGNVRELEQAARRILLTRKYDGDRVDTHGPRGGAKMARELEEGSVNARALLESYCRHLYEKHGNLAEVARITGLDRRTVKRHAKPAE